MTKTFSTIGNALAKTSRGATALSLSLALMVGACSDPKSDTKADETATEIAAHSDAAPDTAHAEEAHINWFGGTVDEAFAMADAEGKPVLLYWGAVWCPPCNQLKATVFKRPDFIAKTNEFVAVYLDGDTERAQKYGEEFEASGYPTLIILNGRDNEVTRIPGGMDLEAYLTVLDLALARVQPAGQLLNEIIDDGREPTQQELTLLAHYSWGQDRGRAMGERDKVEVFNQLSALTPSDMTEDKARLESRYFNALADQDEIDDATREDAVRRAVAFLNNPVATRAEPFFATISAKDFVEKVAGDDATAKAELISALTGAVARMEADETYSPAIWLYTFFGKARLEELTTGEISDGLKAEVRQAVETKLAETTNSYERSTVMNSSIGILLETNQDDYATTLLKEEVVNGADAYYWMVDVASLLEDAGKNDEAVTWFRKAYEESEGPATRAQWGSYYVDGMTRLRADDTVLVRDAALGVIAELAGQEDPIYGRNKGAVKRIGRSLHKWAFDEDTIADLDDAAKAARSDAFHTAESRFQEICNGEFSDETELTACKALFRPAEA